MYKNGRVSSFRQKSLSELRIGTSIRQKLQEIEEEEEGNEVVSSHKSPTGYSPKSPPDVSRPGSPASPGKVQFDLQTNTAKSSVRHLDPSDKKLSRMLSLQNRNRVYSIKNKERSMSQKKHWKRVVSMKEGGRLNRIVSVNKRQLTKVLSLDQIQPGIDTAPILDEQNSSEDDEEQFTIFIHKNNEDLSELFESIYNTEPMRLASVRKHNRGFSSRRSKSIRNRDVEGDSDVEMGVTGGYGGYLTRDEQYELRKKLFYKGEYMILNYALLLIIGLVVFVILFVSLWHGLGGNDLGVYLTVALVFGLILSIVITVKIRLRLARRAPGGYKVDTKIIVNKLAQTTDSASKA